MAGNPFIRAIVACLLVASASSVQAAMSQDLSRQNFRSSICNIDSMTVTFKLDEAFGEPLLTSKMRWRAGPNTSPDCLSRLTYIWLRARTADGTFKYLKLSPEVASSGEDFGPTATESPSWSMLFCDAPTDSAACSSIEESKKLFATPLAFEGFEVITEARTVSGATSTPTSPSPTSKQADAKQSLDSLLAEAIDQAIAPTVGGGTPEAPPAEPVMTPEQIAEQEKRQREEMAHTAVNNVVTLIASSLAQFTAPAHGCESDRVVANWVQARGTCQLNFRSEANHQFLCAENGRPEPVRATRQANINLEKDVERIGPIRISDEGWASVVIQLSGDIRSTTEGNYKTNRWQFTAAKDKLEDIEQLASSILTLKQYCEAEHPQS
ncbi:MAG: hypothetical protein KDI19_14075 [Pseudomonadales bacterium]|nr:hypothetical protein [Pseudomonadales bacterium]